jgi:L-fuconolactonase
MAPLDSFPIVDTHQHLWDLDRFRLPWLAGEAALNKSYRMADYREAVAGLNVVQSVYMEVDVERSQQSAEARYVIDLCERPDNPMTAAVISGRPAEPGFAEYLKQFRDNARIKGLRQVLQGPETPPGYCLDPAFVRGVQQLGDVNLSFDLCPRSGELHDAAKLVAQCHGTRFIVDHCGNLNVQETDPKTRDLWRSGMHELAQHEHVVCKVSGIIATAADAWKPRDLADIIRFTIDTFGPDRVMFASDWPVCTLRASFAAWVAALREVVQDRDEATQRKLFHDNAVAFYQLPAQGKQFSQDR